MRESAIFRRGSPTYLRWQRDFDDLSCLDSGRVLDIAMRKLADVDEAAVLVHPYVDKRTQSGHVGYYALEHHPGLDIHKRSNRFVKARRDELIGWIAPGLA